MIIEFDYILYDLHCYLMLGGWILAVSEQTIAPKIFCKAK